MRYKKGFNLKKKNIIFKFYYTYLNKIMENNTKHKYIVLTLIIHSYSSMLSDHYNQQQNDVPSYLGGNGNNYWQESNVNYFNYQTVSDNIESLSKPNYVGMVPQRAEETPNEATEGAGSSQIVDLDTKEIKTVETDIDMTLCPVIKNETPGDNAVLANANGEGATTAGNTEALIEDIKMLTSTNSIGNEKDVGKVKPDDTTLHEWAIDLMKKYRPGLLENSPKMEILFCILNESVKLGDRVLLFSQSLLTLNLIETFLQMTRMPDSDMCWGRGVSYFRKCISFCYLVKFFLISIVCVTHY